MGLSTPLQRITDSDDINRAISFVVMENTYLRSRQIVHDLRSTPVTDLWPDGVSPYTKEGKLWTVSNEHNSELWNQKIKMHLLMHE